MPDIGTNLFTMEMYARWTVQSGSYPTLCATGVSWTTGSTGIRMAQIGPGRFSFYWNGQGDPLMVASTTIPADTWAHVAIVRYSSTGIKMYVNGALEATAVISSGATINGKLTLGRSPWDGGNGYHTGYIDNFRLAVGPTGVRYTDVFTPPSSLYSDLGGAVSVHPSGTERILGLTTAAGSSIKSNNKSDLLLIRSSGSNWVVESAGITPGNWVDQKD